MKPDQLTNRIPRHIVESQNNEVLASGSLISAGVILATTGIAKMWSGLGNSKLLAVIDPIIGIKFGQLVLAVGLAETLIALVCFFSKRQTLALGLVAWMSTSFVVYRLGLWWMNWHRPCNCRGNLTDPSVFRTKGH